MLVGHSPSYDYSVQSNVKLSFGYPKSGWAKFGVTGNWQGWDGWWRQRWRRHGNGL